MKKGIFKRFSFFISFVFVLILLTSIINLSVFAYTGYSAYVYVTSSSADRFVYVMPDNSSMLVGSVWQEWITVFWKEGSYYYIEYHVGGYGGHKRGYIKDTALNQLQGGIPQNNPYPSWSSTCGSGSYNVYNCTNTSSLYIGYVSSYYSVTVLAEEYDWYYIQYSISGGYKRGYVLKSQINRPASYDVGLQSGVSYYIKNLYTGRYLDVAGGYDDNGTNVIMYDYHGGANQQWRLSKNADGTYKLVSVISPTGKVLDLTGSDIDIWSDNGMYYQQFTFVRDDSMSYGGTYYLKYDSQYVTGNISTNEITITTSGGGLNSMWSLEQVSKGDSDIYSFDYWDGLYYYNSSGANSNFQSYTSEMGYNSYAFENYSATSPLNWLQGDSIWVHSGHGDPAELDFRDSSGNWSYIYASNIRGFSPNQLKNLRCFITVGCSAGLTDSNGNNIIDEVYNKGAHFALGFTNTTYNPVAQWWLSAFFDNARNDSTVLKCIQEADFYANIPWGTGVKYYVGDTYQNLKR